MNLLTLVTTIGQRTGLVGDNDNAACRAFLKLRHDQLYRGFLWKDSLCAYSLAIDPSATYTPDSAYLPTKGQVLLPSIIAHVIAARTTEDRLDVQRPMIYFRMSQDQFAATGTPLEFYRPSKCVWEFDTAKAITVANSLADDGQIVAVDLGNSDGAGVERTNVTLASAGNPQTVGTSDKILAVSNNALSAALTFAVGGTTVVTQALGVQSAPLREQIRLVRIPTKGTTIRVLGKRTTPTFTNDNDVPGVNGLDGVLFALAYYDMCLRDERDLGEAGSAIGEAVGPRYLQDGTPGGFLKKLIEEETDQGASNTRIIPECGFGGEDYFSGPFATKTNPY